MSGLGAYSSKECLSEKGNKPSTAKVSVKGIHRWGMTSYTSLRKARLNGERQKEAEPVKRVAPEDPFSFEPEPAATRPPPPAETKPRPNKFFKSGSRVKNSDFDALRLSAPPSFNSNKDLYVNLHPKQYLTTPNIVDLRYERPPPAVHYIRPAVDSFDTLLKPFGEEVLFGASSQESKSDAYGPSSQESYKSGPSSQELGRSDGFGVSSRELGRSLGFGNSLQESYKSGPSSQELGRSDGFGLSSKELGRSLGFGNSSQESYKSGASSQEFGISADFGASSQESYKSGVFGASSQESYKSGVFGASSQESCETTVYTQEPCKDGLIFGASSQESCKDSIFDASSQESCKDNIFGASSHQEPCNDSIFSSEELCKDTISSSKEKDSIFSDAFQQDKYGASSQDDFLAPMDTDSGQLTQDSLAQIDLPPSQSSEKSTETTKLGSRPKKIFSSSSKFKAVYNHRHWHSSKKSEEAPLEKGGVADEEETPKESFKEELNTSQISSNDQHPKEFYTVVANVKQAYQCHESGETQEFNDDIEYLLEGVQEGNALPTRCLSVLNLAAKCMGPAFRIHLRAHGTMPKIFSALRDAPNDSNLSLCTSALMFVLSQDRLTMDIEASTLRLMLQLLEEECGEPEPELILRDPGLCAMQDRHRERVAQLCEEMRAKGHAKHLKMDSINTGLLAMETLLSLTSRKAGEWFKEEMRTLRGLDRITDTVTSSVESLLPDEQEVVGLPTEGQLDKIRKIDRCLRVLENVTHLNRENQEYLLTYKDSLLISSCLQLLRLSQTHLLRQSSGGEDVLACLLTLLKSLSNITYGIGVEEGGLMEQLLTLILQVPRAVAPDKRFDLLVLSLGLLINLVEYCPANCDKFVGMTGPGSFDGTSDGYELPATEALIELMLIRLESARLSEEQADELLSTQEVKHAEALKRKDVEAAADDLEETLVKTLQKAGKHMEHSIVAAYIVILLGCVAQKHQDYVQVMKDCLPDGNLEVMVEVLKKFKSFVSLTGSVGNRELSSIQKVIHLLESSS